MDRFNDKKDGAPLLSIIIPTHNRPESLKRCLFSLAVLKGGIGDLEIIVVDDGSNPSCESVLGEIPSDRPRLFLRQDNKGPAAARNRGARNACGRFLAFLDDDCSLPTDWIEHVRPSLDNQRMIGGYTINKSASIFSEASQILIDYLYRYFTDRGRQTGFLTSNNMIVPAKIFREIGGFSEIFPTAAAEDRDFCARWLSAGYEIRHVSDIVVEHRHSMNIIQFSRQHFNYGSGAFIYHENKRLSNGGNIELEPLSFYFDLLLFPFRIGLHCHMRAFNLSLCLFLSQLCNFAGYAWARIYHSFLLRFLPRGK